MFLRVSVSIPGKLIGKTRTVMEYMVTGSTLARSVRKIYWRTLRFLGYTKLSWDKQFEAGIWSCGSRSPNTIKMVFELTRGGKLIEFGCGDGSLPFLLPENTFSEYIGYDISEVAVVRAAHRAAEEGAGTIHFEQCDMTEWNGISGASLIVAEECLYYLSPSDVDTFLLKCCNSLCPGGLILVIIHSATKHAKTIEVCRRVCRVEDEAMIGSRTFLTLAPQ